MAASRREAMDWLILSSAELMAVNLPTKTFFGLLVTIWYILNELLSITENAGRMGAPLPSFLVGVIAVLKDNVEHADQEQGITVLQGGWPSPYIGWR